VVKVGLHKVRELCEGIGLRVDRPFKRAQQYW
jgi:hypothetical protein